MSDAPRIDPLPEELRPEPAGPPDGDPEWEARVQRIVGAAEPRLRALRAGARETGGGPAAGWTDLGLWLRPAAGLAAAAALVLVLVRPAPPEADPSPASAALAAAASGGQPAALWRAAGSDAHPVLALIALEEDETR